jgi:hypothetical protein
MRRWGEALALTFCLPAYATYAGAWPLPQGDTQVILKFEDSQANSAFDPSGNRVAIPHLRDDSLSLFVERGLTDRLTLQGKVGYTEGEDQFVRYSGRGPVELGLRYALLNGPKGVLSVYVGAVAAGEGRNAGYAPPNAGQGDIELRLLAGRNITLRGQPVFAEVQVARLFRRGLPDETHIDATLGWKLGSRWLVLAQAYSGRADPGGTDGPVAPEWLKLETSVVRHMGPWSVQLGWREAAWGHESPIERGPVIGVWRRF